MSFYSHACMKIVIRFAFVFPKKQPCLYVVFVAFGFPKYSQPSLQILAFQLEVVVMLRVCGNFVHSVGGWYSSQGLAALDWCRTTLKTSFPSQSYTDRSQTLEAAGLVPSANLFVSIAQAA
eukprot:1452722-Amphidinium_carterae.2